MSEQILKLPEVKSITSLSRSSVYRLITQGSFPKQIKLSERSSGWARSDVEKWLADRIEMSRNGEAT